MAVGDVREADVSLFHSLRHVSLCVHEGAWQGMSIKRPDHVRGRSAVHNTSQFHVVTVPAANHSLQGEGARDCVDRCN